MVASTRTRQSDPTVPSVVCPKCGLRMRLATVEPTGNNDRMVTFGCTCGNRYELSERAIIAIARDNSDRW